MRLILSTIFAAALVFGGVLLLLFAGCFAGIEVRGEGQPEQASRQSPDSETRRTTWQCPEVERILAGPLPEIFAPYPSPERLSLIDADFILSSVTLEEVYDDDAVSARGNYIKCEYWQEGEPYVSNVTLRLVSGLNAEIVFETEAKKYWLRTWTDHGWELSYSCRKPLSPADCAFFVFEGKDVPYKGDIWPPETDEGLTKPG